MNYRFICVDRLIDKDIDKNPDTFHIWLCSAWGRFTSSSNVLKSLSFFMLQISIGKEKKVYLYCLSIYELDV